MDSMGYKHACAALAVMSGLAACAGFGGDDEESVDAGVQTAVSRTEAGLGDAILSPAEDLNLKRVEIPVALKRLKQVYTPDRAFTCSDIEGEIKVLDQALGPDEDARTEEEKSDSEKAGEGAADATLGAVSGTTSGIIPFRGVVRLATGATAHERRLRQAYSAGLQRRAYLKGLGQAMGCAPPAAPAKPPPEDARILFKR